MTELEKQGLETRVRGLETKVMLLMIAIVALLAVMCVQYKDIKHVEKINHMQTDAIDGNFTLLQMYR